jgi:hypothetical protein
MRELLRLALDNPSIRDTEWFFRRAERALCQDDGIINSGEDYIHQIRLKTDAGCSQWYTLEEQQPLSGPTTPSGKFATYPQEGGSKTGGDQSADNLQRGEGGQAARMRSNEMGSHLGDREPIQVSYVGANLRSVRPQPACLYVLTFSAWGRLLLVCCLISPGLDGAFGRLRAKADAFIESTHGHLVGQHFLSQFHHWGTPQPCRRESSTRASDGFYFALRLSADSRPRF